MELQISHSVCAEVSQESILQGKTGGNREDTETVVRVERGKNNRSRSMPGPHTHVGGNSAKAGSSEFHGVPERKEQHDVVRAIRRTEVQVSKQRVLVQGILCRHSREKHKSDTGIHTKSAERR